MKELIRVKLTQAESTVIEGNIVQANDCCVHSGHPIPSRPEPVSASRSRGATRIGLEDAPSNLVVFPINGHEKRGFTTAIRKASQARVFPDKQLHHLAMTAHHGFVQSSVLLAVRHGQEGVVLARFWWL